jgi:hypothetical protein
MGLTSLYGILPPPPDGLYLIENLVFKGKKLQLDGYRFKNCAFVDCLFEVNAGNFKIEECFLQGNWWCQFGGIAQRVTKLISILDPESAGPDLKAVVHPNGGVTIA